MTKIFLVRPSTKHPCVCARGVAEMLRVLGRVLLYESNLGLSCRLLAVHTSKLSQDVAVSSSTEESMDHDKDILGDQSSAMNSLYSMRLRNRHSVLRQFHKALQPLQDTGRLFDPCRNLLDHL